MRLANRIEPLTQSNRTSKWIQTPRCEESERLSQLQQMVHYAPVLEIKVLSSQSVEKGTSYRINCQGLENSQRGALDGFVFFGSKKRIRRSALKFGLPEGETRSRTSHSSEIVNDIIIKSPDPLVNKKHIGHHFQIEYSLSQNGYLLKDLGIGFGVFQKLDYPILLKDNHLINIGLVFMVVNFVLGDESEIDNDMSSYMQDAKNLLKVKMRLKFYGGPCNGDVVVIRPEQRSVTIGRSKECFIQFEDQLLSKRQCVLQFDDEKGWVLHDGSGPNQSPSTNGTWLYLGEEQ